MRHPTITPTASENVASIGTTTSAAMGAQTAEATSAHSDGESRSRYEPDATLLESWVICISLFA